MGALELRARSTSSADASGATVIDQANAAATRLRRGAPQDPTLLTVRAVLVSMFAE